MAEQCLPAQAKRLTAVHVLGQLVLAAEGLKPNPCYRVRFEQSPLDVEPPQFDLRACVDAEALCAQVVVPFQTVQVFAIGTPRDSVTVVTSAGPQTIAVLVVDDPSPLGRSEPAALVQFSSLSPARRESLAASPWSPTHQDSPDDATALASLGALALPLRISALFEGRLETLAPRPRRAIGYSDTWSFEEAFGDAVKNLPPAYSGEADHLTTVRVTSMGAQLGGFAGFHRMFVAIVAH